ncbi:MAG: hypothetical protein NTY09_13250, partial [bacterium]|nr:hypothetical protein [bacterium]
MKITIWIVAAVVGIFILSIIPAISQENQNSGAPPLYSIDGDEVYIESDDAGSTHFFAEGHAVLTYIAGDETWTLSAEKVEFIGEKDAGGRIIPHLANAEGNINLLGPNIAVTAPGSIEVNILDKWVISDSENIHIVFQDGDLTTDSLEIHETSGDDGVKETVVNTDIRTVAILQLSEIMPPESGTGTEGSIFGSLKFDFSEITIETSKIEFEIIDNRASTLNCSEETKVTSNRNTMTMPRARITFNPDTLEGPDGVELLVGEDTTV